MSDDRSGVRLREERTETVRRIAALDAELNGIIESALLSNNDDEHDPDGATTGYERAKATAMLGEARMSSARQLRRDGKGLSGAAADLCVRIESG